MFYFVHNLHIAGENRLELMLITQYALKMSITQLI